MTDSVKPWTRCEITPPCPFAGALPPARDGGHHERDR
jgi:hypothetical protein